MDTLSFSQKGRTSRTTLLARVFFDCKLPICRPSGQNSSLNKSAFSPDMKWIFAGGPHGAVRFSDWSIQCHLIVVSECCSS